MKSFKNQDSCHIDLPVELLAPRSEVKVSGLDLRWL